MSKSVGPCTTAHRNRLYYN